MEKRKAKEKKRVPLRGEKLRKLRQMWVHGTAWNASLDELGLTNICVQTKKIIV